MILFDAVVFTLLIVLTVTSRAVLTNNNTPVFKTFRVLFPGTFILAITGLGISQIACLYSEKFFWNYGSRSIAWCRDTIT